MIVNDYLGNEVNCEGLIFQPQYGIYITNMVFCCCHDLPDDYDFTGINLLEHDDFVLLFQSDSEKIALEYCEALVDRLRRE